MADTTTTKRPASVSPNRTAPTELWETSTALSSAAARCAEGCLRSPPGRREATCTCGKRCAGTALPLSVADSCSRACISAMMPADCAVTCSKNLLLEKLADWAAILFSRCTDWCSKVCHSSKSAVLSASRASRIRFLSEPACSESLWFHLRGPNWWCSLVSAMTYCSKVGADELSWLLSLKPCNVASLLLRERCRGMAATSADSLSCTSRTGCKSRLSCNCTPCAPTAAAAASPSFVRMLPMETA
mmetsp:Transcript_54103/g.125848  ORF Transcript_54103/g.125848 Transcript_54103/m.125848 type:complete len:245 (+) Transcript_54103:1521-2255(+)